MTIVLRVVCVVSIALGLFVLPPSIWTGDVHDIVHGLILVVWPIVVWPT